MSEKKLVRCLDKRRRNLLRAGSIERAAHLSIGLVLVLARMGWRERIPPVIEELRAAVRRRRWGGEALFALYEVTNAVERGTDVTEAAARALARLARPGKMNDSSGANDGAGVCERGSSMQRSSMETTQSVQELKSERVQEELVQAVETEMEEPYRIWLKSERVREPASFTTGLGDKATVQLELALNRAHPVTVELIALQTVITFHGVQAPSPDQAG